MSWGHLEPDITAVWYHIMKNLPHHQDDIPLPSALKRHNFKLYESFPLVEMLKTDTTGEEFI